MLPAEIGFGDAVGDAGGKLTAGVGSDGNLTAVGGLKGDVYVLGPDGKLLWHVTAPGEIDSPPLVGNGLVIVRTIDGQVIAFFVMVVAAAEVVVGLAIIVSIFRSRHSASVDDANLMKL